MATPAGQQHAAAVVGVVAALNSELSQRVDGAQLAAPDAVLRAACRSASPVASELPGGSGRRPEPRWPAGV